MAGFFKASSATVSRITGSLDSSHQLSGGILRWLIHRRITNLPSKQTHFFLMENTELSLDQLQAVTGGATAIEYGLIAACRPVINNVFTDCEGQNKPGVKR